MRLPALGLVYKTFLQMYLANRSNGAAIWVVVGGGQFPMLLPVLADPPDFVDIFWCLESRVWLLFSGPVRSNVWKAAKSVGAC